jgi:hypothetical protein
MRSPTHEKIQQVNFKSLLAFHFTQSPYVARFPALQSTPEIDDHLKFTAHTSNAQLIMNYHWEEFRPYINTATMQWFLSHVAN